MRRLIAAFALTVLLALGLTGGFTALVNRGLRGVNSGIYGKLNHLLIGKGCAPHDILFLGSSRVWFHIDPMVIDSVTGRDSYNGGLAAARSMECEAIWSAYMKVFPSPELVVYHVDFDSFDTEKAAFRPTVWYPYLSKPEVGAVVEQIDGPAWFIRRVPWLAAAYYQDHERALGLRGVLGLWPPQDHIRKGFQPSWKFAWGADATELLERHVTAIVSSHGLESYERVLDSILESGSRVIVITSPQHESMWRIVTNYREVIDAARMRAADRGIEFLTYDHLAMCKSREWFYDPGHLTPDGAREFSRILGNDLKQRLR